MGVKNFEFYYFFVFGEKGAIFLGVGHLKVFEGGRLFRIYSTHNDEKPFKNSLLVDSYDFHTILRGNVDNDVIDLLLLLLLSLLLLLMLLD